MFSVLIEADHHYKCKEKQWVRDKSKRPFAQVDLSLSDGKTKMVIVMWHYF